MLSSKIIGWLNPQMRQVKALPPPPPACISTSAYHIGSIPEVQALTNPPRLFVSLKVLSPILDPTHRRGNAIEIFCFN